MRQNAVSIAPQNEVPIQIAPKIASTPIVVELSRMLASVFSSVSLLAAGKSRSRSVMTLSSIVGL